MKTYILANLYAKLTSRLLHKFQKVNLAHKTVKSI